MTMKADKLRAMTNEELETQEKELKAELFNLLSPQILLS